MDATHPWNQMLLAEIPDIFVEAVMSLVARASQAALRATEAAGACHERPETVARTADDGTGIMNIGVHNDSRNPMECGEGYLLDLLFAMIPLPGQTNEFFAGIPRAVLSRLRNRRFIPASDGGYVLPSEAVRAPALEPPMEVYTAKVLSRMGLHFVRSEVVIPAELERELGVRPLSALLCDVLTCASRLWSDKRSTGSAEKSVDCDDSLLDFDRAWLINVLGALERSSDCSSRLDELRALPLFPLAGGGELARLRDGDVFEVDGAAASADLNLWLTAGIRVLCPQFLAEIAGNRAASAMARRLGLRSVDSEVFLLKHLVPAMATPTLPAEALVRMLAAAKRVASAVAPGLLGGRLETEMIRSGALLVDSEGRRVPAGIEPLHFSQKYFPVGIPAFKASDLFRPLSDNSDDKARLWPLVSSAYLDCDGDQPGWFTLLRGLGVTIFVRVDPSPPYSCQELGAFLPTASDTDGRSAGECIPPELARLTHVGRILSILWEAEYSRLASAAENSDSPESFLAILRRLCWIPGTDGKLHTPSEVYARGAKTALEVLGKRAVLSCENGVDGLLAVDLRLRDDLSESGMISTLEDWAANGEPVSLDLMRRVYSFLSRGCRSSAATDIFKALATIRCVFVPNRQTASVFNPKHIHKGTFFKLKSEVDIPGVWMRLQDCVWKDESHLLDNFICWKHGLRISDAEHHLAAQAAGCRAVGFYYCDDLRDFFCNGLGISETPPHERYLNLWRGAADIRPATRYSIACVLRVCVHFSYEYDYAHRGLCDEAEIEYSPLLRIVVSNSSSLYVPNASGDSLSALSQVRWIADVDHDRAIKEQWFGSELLEHCVPARHSGLHGVFDARQPAVRAENDEQPAIIAHLDDQMRSFYVKMLRLPRLSDVLTRLIECQAVGQIGKNEGMTGNTDARLTDDSVSELKPPTHCPLCHVAMRTIQGFLLDLKIASEDTEAIANSADVSRRPLELIKDSAQRLRLRRVAAVEVFERWVATSSTGPAGSPGPLLRFASHPVARRQVACGMDLAHESGPVMLVAEPALHACPPEVIAAAFGRMCSGEQVSTGSVIHHRYPHLPRLLLPHP